MTWTPCVVLVVLRGTFELSKTSSLPAELWIAKSSSSFMIQIRRAFAAFPKALTSFFLLSLVSYAESGNLPTFPFSNAMRTFSPASEVHALMIFSLESIPHTLYI